MKGGTEIEKETLLVKGRDRLVQQDGLEGFIGYI
jgi:hypothetical protein